MFKETEKKLFVIVKNDDKWRPKFYVNNQAYGLVSWIIRDVSKETKDIIPTKWDNVGKTITIHNLIISMVSTDGEYDLQLPLYSWLARTAMNAIAGWYNGEEVFFSVYNNKNGFRSMSVRHSQEREDYITPFYSWEQEIWKLKETKIKGEIKKDYDTLSDEYVIELLPIIKEKLSAMVSDTIPQSEDNDIPF
jgi:hypothetical protein